eukprot:TRINITY_DN939_c0_g1_i4.p2 TRINITY_DN939_c0_g1~~TRINITY_DN939_c0_g1_i4.p2  ORF type:complete len:135 (-),score=13.65 TRINITY_DN939_c0_g1_i4:67-471(-)
MWDLRDPKPVPIGIKWENEPGIPPCKLYAAQISHGNERFLLAGGSGSNEARLFDIFDSKSTPTLLATMRYMPKACYTVDFSTQGDMCAISGGDGLIRVVDIFKPEQSFTLSYNCLLYTSPSPRDLSTSRMPSSA